jgi:hypothetical protein
MRRALALLLSLLLVAACNGEDGGTDPPRPGGLLILSVRHEADGAPLALGDAGLGNAAGNTYSVERLEYYLGRVSLHRPDGVSWNLPLARSFHYVSLGDSATWTWEIEGVPPGTYESMTLGFGLPADLNVDGALGPDPPHSDMAWPAPLGGGYHDLKLEGLFEGGGYALHGGILRQGAATFGGESLNELAHETYEITTDPVRIRLVLDLDEVFVTPHEIDLGAWFPGAVMDDPTAQRWIQENCADLLRVEAVEIVEEEAAVAKN